MKTKNISRVLTALVAALLLASFPLGSLAQTAAPIVVKTTADDTLVNGNCTLREAIIAANTDSPVDACPAGSGADTIILPEGEYALQIIGPAEDQGYTGDLDIHAPLTIVGAGGGATILGYGAAFEYLDRDRTLQIFASAGQVTLQKLTISGSRALLPSTVPGGIGIFSAADLTLIDCLVADNGAEEYSGIFGGGIYSLGSLHLLRTHLQANFASRGGGVYNSGDALIEDSSFTGNRADEDDYAAGIFSDGQLEVLRSTFSGNYAAAAGAIRNDGTLTMRDSHLDDNTARFAAAALDNRGVAVLTNVTANNNGVGHYIGAIRNTGTLTMTHGTIMNNTSYDYAGGIASEGGWLHLEDVEIAGNSSGGSGGGLYVGAEAVRLVKVNLHNNTSSVQDGGGAYIYGTATIIDSAIIGNTAASDGGGLYVHGVLILSNSVVSGNHTGIDGAWAETRNGGGIYANLGILAFYSSRIESNIAAENGGGIYNANAMLEMYGGTASGNYAEYDGGGVYSHGATYLWGVNTDNNYAHDDGGGIYTSGEMHLTGGSVSGNWGWGMLDWNLGGGGIANSGTLYVDDATIAYNWTIWQGGGISNVGDLVIDHSTLRENVARDWAGGIWQGNGTLALTNSTLYGNRGDAGGGGLGLNGGAANLLNATLTANQVAIGWQHAAGGGIQALGGELIIHNTLLAGNVSYYGGSAETIDCQFAPEAVINNLGYNLVGITDGCNWLSAPGDQTGTLAAPLDPGLLPIAEYPNATALLAPMQLSPLIDAGDASGCPGDDQRQVERPQGAACDIGAVEAVSIPAAIDIRPGLVRNLIDRTSPFRVPVALLSGAGFAPAELVNRATLTFGHTGFENSLFYLNTKPVCSTADLNGDGVLDLVCEFVIARTGFQCGDTLGYLRAYGTHNELIAGQDAVVIVPCR